MVGPLWILGYQKDRKGTNIGVEMTYTAIPMRIESNGIDFGRIVGETKESAIPIGNFS